MDLPGPRAVFRLAGQQARGLRHQAEESVDPHGVIGTPYQPHAMFLHRPLDGIGVIHPSGGAQHQVDAQGGDAFHVAPHGGGNGEIDGHIDAAEILRGEAFEVGVVELIELQRHSEAVTRGKLFHQLTHLAVADDGQLAVRHAAPRVFRMRRGRDRRKTHRAAKPRRAAGRPR